MHKESPGRGRRSGNVCAQGVGQIGQRRGGRRRRSTGGKVEEKRGGGGEAPGRRGLEERPGEDPRLTHARYWGRKREQSAPGPRLVRAMWEEASAGWWGREESRAWGEEYARRRRRRIYARWRRKAERLGKQRHGDGQRLARCSSGWDSKDEDVAAAACRENNAGTGSLEQSGMGSGAQ
ncbi:hypothetical protein OsJ_33752 [Oryza sativa Japonica Group]|uniref:Uncharacterized protein n=1 Tax=Oryza sativa subsp. japonica TaxID=39947 RepID=B9GAH5_ORYSJ|nr:hypothetical protein OsJ_33752 [Oryza sativa Japonica Group]